MNYRYFQGWKKRTSLPTAAYLLPFLLPALVILGGWASSLVG